jgi:hypothetical protein
VSLFDALAARLNVRAAVIAKAEAERRRDTRWWRRAGLLWPLFTKG